MLNCDRIYARISLNGELLENFQQNYTNMYIYTFTPHILHICIKIGVEISENVPW